MADTLTESEKAQLEQTIEMFEVITVSQPTDYQSLEILKEAYNKLGRDAEVVATAKSIAHAYEKMGQLTSAILEYESILGRNPDDAEAKEALERLEKNDFFAPGIEEPEPSAPQKGGRGVALDDGRTTLETLFVGGSIITQPDFDTNWPTQGAVAPGEVVPPLIHNLAERNLVPVETSMSLVVERSKLSYLPIDKYDLDLDLARAYPKDICMTHCSLPFDRMSKVVFVATANPFSKAAESDLMENTDGRVVFFVTPPEQIIKLLGAVFH